MRGQSPGNGSCTSVEGGSERSTGSPGGPLGSPLARSARRRAVAGASPSGSALPWPRWPSTLRPGPIASTTTSSGRPPPSSRARPRSATRSTARRRRSGNAYFQDVLPDRDDRRRRRAASCPSRRCRPSLLLPFVAMWGLATDDQALFTVLAAVDVAICWWMLGGSPVRLGDPGWRRPSSSPSARCSGTRAQLATTWYQAHIVAIGLHDAGGRRRARRGPAQPMTRTSDADGPTWLRRRGRSRSRAVVRCRRLGASSSPGLLFGLACTARLTVVFGAPFFAARRCRRELRGVAAGRPGSAPPSPSALLLGLQPGDDRPALPSRLRLPVPARDRGYPTLGYHPDWAIEDPRYLPQNLGIMLLGLPDILPDRLPDAWARRRPRSAREPGAVARPVRPALPAGGPTRHRDEPAARPARRTCSRSRRSGVRAEPARHGRGARDRRRRAAST